MASSTSAFVDESQKRRQSLNDTNDYSEYSDSKNNDIPIRLVCVGGTPPHTIDEIKAFFGQFGEIESISVQSRDFVLTHLVQFKHEASAKKALLHTEERWCGFEVKAVDSLHQPDHPLQVAPPEPDSDSNIVNALNQDCTQDIFKRLELTDLTNVANACKHFREQAKITFASKHTHLNVKDQFKYHSHLIETAMEHFGKDIQSLCIEEDSLVMGSAVIRIIGELCGPKLKRLELQGFQFQIDLTVLRPIFAGLEQLKLHGCSGGGISLDRLMAGCAELKSLTLSHCNDGNRYIEQTFPKLQEISFERTEMSEKYFENFLIRHPTLIKLSIENMTHTSRALRSIGLHAKNLQELKFILNNYNYSFFYEHYNQYQPNAASISQLNSLKNLQLVLVGVTYQSLNVLVLNALIAGEVPVESLDIRLEDAQTNDSIECILQLKNIKNLRLKIANVQNGVTDTVAIELAKCLPVLEELHLEDYGFIPFKSQLTTIGLRKMLMHANKLKLLELRSINGITIDIDDYKMMLDTVRKRKEMVPLAIEIHGNEDQIDIPAAVLAENKNVINIKMLKY